MPVPVEFPSLDGTVLRGECVGREDDWLVTVHDMGDDLDSLGPVGAWWGDGGPSVLAFDLRGHGASDGKADRRRIGDDVTAACRFASQRGARNLYVLAIGSSCMPALRSAQTWRVRAFVLLSPERPSALEVAALQERLAAKLILYGAHDPQAAIAAEEVRASSGGWASTVSFPTAEQARALFQGYWRGHVGERVSRFVDEQRYLATLQLRRH